MNCYIYGAGLGCQEVKPLKKVAALHAFKRVRGWDDCHLRRRRKHHRFQRDTFFSDSNWGTTLFYVCGPPEHVKRRQAVVNRRCPRIGHDFSLLKAALLRK